MQREKSSKRPSPSTDDESGTDNSNAADKFEWIGEPLKSSAHRDFYKAVRVIETGNVVKMRDNVIVEAGDDQEPYVAQCLAMWEDKRTGVRWMRTQWYYRAGDVPEHVLDTVKSYSHIIGKGGLRKREVFESQSHDDNDLRAMITTATVVHDATEFSRLQKNVAGSTTFLCRFLYDPREQVLKPLEVGDRGSSDGDDAKDEKPRIGLKASNKNTTSDESASALTSYRSATKATRTMPGSSKTKTATLSSEPKAPKQPKPKAKQSAKARSIVQKKRNNIPVKSAPATFVYSRDVGESDVFSVEQELPEVNEDGSTHKAVYGGERDVEEDHVRGSLSRESENENSSEQDDSESEIGTKQALLTPSSSTTHARIGQAYQAEVPAWDGTDEIFARGDSEITGDAEGKTDNGDDNVVSTCVWHPSRFTYGVTEAFLASARQLMQLNVGQRVQVLDSCGASSWCLILEVAEGSSPLRKVHLFDGFSDWHVFACECRLPFPEDLALRCLMHADGDMGRALRIFNRVLKDRIFLSQNPQSPQWKKREVKAFCEVIHTHRDDLVAVTRSLRQRGIDKTYQDVLQLYYSLYLPRRSKRLANLWADDAGDGTGNHVAGSAEEAITPINATDDGMGKKRGRDSDIFSSSADKEDSTLPADHKKRHVPPVGVWSVKVDPDEPMNPSATELLKAAKPLLSEQQQSRLKSYLRQQYNPRNDLPHLIKKTISLLTPFPLLLNSYASLISEIKSARS